MVWGRVVGAAGTGVVGASGSEDVTRTETWTGGRLSQAEIQAEGR